MAAALQAAQDRIAADAAHAEQLTSDLATANQKLKTLEDTIKKASATVRTRTVSTVSTATNAGGTTSHHDDDG
jgi:flagellar motility protein MotE (MotC chaperone)